MQQILLILMVYLAGLSTFMMLERFELIDPQCAVDETIFRTFEK